MKNWNPSVLHRQAENALQNAAYNPKKLVLLHTSVSLGASLIVTILNFYLSYQIEGTGGLSGLGLRSILSTIQSVLEFATTLLLPFWEIGLVFLALCWVNNQSATPDSILQGFRRFGPVFVLRLLQTCLFLFLGLGTLYLSVMVFLLTPLAEPLIAIMEPVLQNAAAQQSELLFTPEQMAAAAEEMTPVFLMFGAFYLVIAVPLFYRLRFSTFALMSGCSAPMAIRQSFRMTKRAFLRLVRLDLHFWWYYLLQGLFLLLCYGDMLLPFLGISLPFSEEISFFLFFVLGTSCQWLLFWQCRGTVITTYAMAYQSLLPKPNIP